MRHTLLVLVLALLAVAPAPRAQVTPAAPLVVMNLAAHPDDEDGATMAYYRHVKNAVVYSVIYTRGEGGQNEIGPELYERLGAIRTAETEAAARILGTQVYYLNFFDFGYSKWASETFAEWSRPRRGFWDTDHTIVSEAAGRDSVTARLVYLIRLLKPDVVFTNHDTVTVAPRAQHGHHQAVGLSAWDAFALAADSAYHPEQLREPGVELWQPQRLFVRSRTRGAHDVAVHVGADCGGGESCGDRAVRGAVLHRSQGFDLLAPRFFRRDTTYFTLYRDAEALPLEPNSSDLAAGLKPNPHAADVPMHHLEASGRAWPFGSGDYLLWLSRANGHPPSLYHRGESRSIDGHRGALWGLSRLIVVAGETLRLSQAHLTNNDTFTRWAFRRVRVTLDGALREELLKLEGQDRLTFQVPDAAVPTHPAYRFQYEHQTASPLYYRAEELWAPDTLLASDRHGLISRGGVFNVEVAPPVRADLAPAPVRLAAGANVIPVSVRTYDPAVETVTVRLRIESTEVHSTSVPPPLLTDSLRIAPADTAAVFHFDLPADAPVGEYRVTIEATASPTSAPAEPYVETRPAAILPDIRVADGLRVGFVRSYDLTTENALGAMGADVVSLDSLALADSRFDGLHTIVLDIRAYLARPDLRRHNDNLLDWVRAGGHLVVTYQKTFEWNAGAPDPTQPEESGVVNPDFAPFPLELGRDRVVREDAPVEVLAPDHSLFNSPHEIRADDWAGWVQERGLYFPETYDARYRELLSMSDPGEAPLRGGLLLADVGAGTYFYSPLVWYRQLEALNAGAWRLFANLVSLPLTTGSQ